LILIQPSYSILFCFSCWLLISLKAFVRGGMQEGGVREAERWDGYVDWRNRPAAKGRHGGMVAASFVLGKSTSPSTVHALLARFSF
jgi:hypothetical protein